ncbi:hypothetical protein EST38_g5069 [Candolleomyces aberdarensis]|uniref:ceramidase n=1 Tax=Candolleomyces aberdarensis TaxID=2316362 RepID=A0A4Q2DNR2_9AGAR|nr:hypothetical protein EST38_g5069 [Candolleomyces aberdarensis]
MQTPSTSTLDSLEEAPPQCEQATSPNSSTSTFHRHSKPRTPRIRIRSSQLPLYTVDLSLPPAKRYTQICHDFRDALSEFKHLYHAVLELATSDRQLPFPFSAMKRGAVRVLAKMVLRRVYSKEESEEIKGIQKATGMKLEEVVGLNTFLDLFCGCVSGGVKAQRTPTEDGEDTDDTPTMLHFRGLDWEMDSLRDLLIQVQYVRDGQVVARAVTYAGYVGTLTGVREGLSMSMNYRLRFLTSPSAAPNSPDDGSSSKPLKRPKSSLFRYRLHQLCLLFGLRPSIASQLRSLLLSPGPAPTLDEVQDWCKSEGGSPSYLTFCSKDEVLIIENDLVKRHSRSSKGDTSTPATPAPSSSPTTPATYRSDTFLTVTNHDRALESLVNSPHSPSWIDILRQNGFEDDGDGEDKISVARKIMESSMQRKACVEKLYQECVEKPQNLEKNVSSEGANPNLEESESDPAAGPSQSSSPSLGNSSTPSPTTPPNAAQPEVQPSSNPNPPPSKTKTTHNVEVEDIKTWLRTYPLRNETTHFSCIMDPSARDGGAIVWVEACEEV